MPSLRKRVSTYLRQLSFHNEPRDKKNSANENAFVTKYLQGLITLREGPPIVYGKNPTDLPSYELGRYKSGASSVIGCYSGPNGGLTTVKRTEKHLSVLDDDIDFIDNHDEEEPGEGEEPSVPAADDAALPPEWSQKSDTFYGISDSLYDRNQVTRLKNGDPIADCFGLIAREDSAILAVADGVNWGEKASVAAKSAIHASLHYLNKTIFNDTKPFEKLTIKGEQSLTNDTLNPVDNGANLVGNTREVFVCLLRAFNCAHDLILENKGMLTTLTVAVILPIKSKEARRDSDGSYVCCVCNVGDTLAYVYSQKTGIRELTKGSHDVNSNRDMRDALGALGPVDGINPELSNLTLSITTLQKGDIVMVASDGLTDNFDPNVCKFTVNSNIETIKTRAKKPSANQENLRPPRETAQKVPPEPPQKPPRRSKLRATSLEPEMQQNPSVANHFIRANSVEEPRKETKKPPAPVIENKASSLRKQAARKISPPTHPGTQTGRYKFLKSKTSLDLRPGAAQNRPPILRNDEGIPYVSPIQRYELQLLLMEDILKRGISGRDSPINDARKLCETLVSFAISVTAAKRRTLEDREMYYDNRNGVMVEVSNQEKRARRKRGLERVQSLPGKLDHVTAVAYNVGNVVG
ncbi:PP2C-like domain-containing protein CG9801 isoform X2 [Anthonomus grandis grandis]|uniref:PP2C-like domain-containing protein CG9801 isoform X2 n=1 Tax=Anthonomus grandis grandis TaxID=2921223 RepID=UPI0021659A45|nr:PP2C-like domain-containing protein CG9801 isoform X2 [Anthonomus grandis grandis]